MYITECFENGLALRNYFYIYVCKMPVYLSTLVAIVLMLEIAYAVWSTFYINSQLIRNRQLMVDVITDLFCLIFPLTYMYYGARVRLEMSEVLYLVSPPTCFLLSKINDIWSDIFEIDLERIKGKNLTDTTRKSGRRRNSILNLTASKEQMEAQLKYFPRKFRIVFTFINAFYFAFFFCNNNSSSCNTASRCYMQ